MKQVHGRMMCAVVAGAVASAALWASAQAPAGGAPGGAAAGAPRRVASIKLFKTNRVENPEYAVRPKGPAQPNRNWIQIQVEYDVEPEWQDQLDIAFYAVIKNTRDPKSPPQLLLKCSTTYLNLKKGRHKCEAYLHPTVLERWGDIEAKAVVLTVGGQMVGGEADPPPKSKWWEKGPALEGLLISGADSPFALTGGDEFDAAKKGAP